MLSLLVSSLLVFHYVQAPIVTLREAPSDDAKTVSQAIFAEEVVVLESQGDWMKIETKDDKCAGWTHKAAITERDEAYADCSCITPLVEVTSLSASVYEDKDISNGPTFLLPFECRLEAIDPYDDPDCSWITLRLPDGGQAFIQRHDVTCDIHAISKEEIGEFSRRFLHVPFIGGGRSSFGYDSSGFIQMLYRNMGLTLPRHSHDQCEWEGFEEVSIEMCELGDLIFWGNSESDIQHVGMYLDDYQFIHASPFEEMPGVCISDLNAPLYNGVANWTFRVAKRLK